MQNRFITYLKYKVIPILGLLFIIYLLFVAIISFPAYTIMGVVFLILLGVSRYVWVKKTSERRGWRTYALGIGAVYYEELRDGKWEKIEIGGERLCGKPRYVIYLGSAETWKKYPEWAQNRREEIISRIKSVLKEPEYKYLGAFYRYEWAKDTNFNGIKVYIGKPPVEFSYKSLGLISEEGHKNKVEAMVTNLISTLTAKASSIGANAIINWHIIGAGDHLKGEGEAVIFEKEPNF